MTSILKGEQGFLKQKLLVICLMGYGDIIDWYQSCGLQHWAWMGQKEIRVPSDTNIVVHYILVSELLVTALGPEWAKLNS